MILSLNLIRKYIDIPRRLSPEDIKTVLSGSTVEVERLREENGDALIDIDNKSLTNRPDLWSHYGIARELAALLRTPLRPVELQGDDWGNLGGQGISVEIKAKQLCPRYIAARIEGIVVRESPEWLKKALISIGLNPINNMVDITNYVLAEIGQPLHAFDARIFGNDVRVVVRESKNKECLKVLGGAEYSLGNDNLVIADAGRPIALAGIMGGADTGVSDKTVSIVLESATFSAPSVRRTSQSLGIKTESSMRFEKGLHRKLAETGMRRALYLIAQVIPESRLAGVCDKTVSDDDGITIKTSCDFLNKKIGVVIPRDRVKAILSDLGFEVSETGLGELNVSIPWWRSTGDISTPEDLVEEVARMYGYDNLAPGEQFIELRPAAYQLRFDMELRLKQLLATGCGMSEVFNYPWQDAEIGGLLGLSGNNIELVNPPAPEYVSLQTSLAPNLMKNVRDNIRFTDSFGLFEVARVFRQGTQAFDGRDKLPAQPKIVAGVMVAKKEEVLFELKGVVEHIFKMFGYDNIDWIAGAEKSFLNPASSMRIKSGAKDLGYMGLVTKGVTEYLGCGGKYIVFFEIDYEALLGGRMFLAPRLFNRISKYPPVLRDLSYFIPPGISAEAINKVITSAASAKLKEHIFFDIYVKNGKKSISSHLVFQSYEGTLTDAEIDADIRAIIKALENNGCVIR